MENYSEEEISLKELILVLVSGWKIILGIMFIGVVLAAVYSFFIVQPVYETELSLFMNISEDETTEVGVYSYPSNKPKDFFELIYNADVINKTAESFTIDNENFTNQLNISQAKDSNVVRIKLKGGDPEEITQILNEHVLNYQKYLNYQFREDAINKFLVENKVLLSLKHEKLDMYEEQLVHAKGAVTRLQQTIPLQKALTMSPETAAKYARDNGLTISELSDQLLVEEVMNENYIEAEKALSSLELSIDSLKVEVLDIEKRIKILEEEEGILSTTDMFEVPQNEFLSVLELSFNRISSATVPQSRVSPRRTMIVAIAMVISCMVSVLIVFLKAYWEKN